MAEYVDSEVTAGVATVTLDRPGNRNALNDHLLEELQRALERAEAASDVYAVVVTGAEPAFSAGGDVAAIERWADADRETFERELGQFQAVVSQLRSMGTPSIAAVNGPAVGAGCDIALACDVRFVAPEAELTEGFVTLGLISGDGGAWLLPRLIGESRAKQYLLTGATIDADEAVDIGLAVEQTPDVVERARAFASELRDLPAAAVQWTKQLATTSVEDLDDHLARATAAQWDCLQDDEHRAAFEARLAGRSPDLDR